MAIVSVYLNEIPIQLPGTLIHPLALADLASGSTSPNSSLQQPPFSDRRISLIVANSYLFCSGTLSFLVFFRSRRKSRPQALYVGFAPKRTKESSNGTHSHPHTQNEWPPSCYTSSFFVNNHLVFRLWLGNPFVSQSRREFYVSFSVLDFALSIHHSVLWVKILSFTHFPVNHLSYPVMLTILKLLPF